MENETTELACISLPVKLIAGDEMVQSLSLSWMIFHSLHQDGRAPILMYSNADKIV